MGSGPNMSSSLAPPTYVRTASGAFLRSLNVDRSLARFDLAGSIAHVEMLGRCGLLSPEEVDVLHGGLIAVAGEIRTGVFPWREQLEDVHTNIEHRLTELVGPAGGKLHTGRSRNDQIALDERLFLRQAIQEIATALLGLEQALLEAAEADVSTPMPGYTHLQRAQLVTVGHWLLAHFWRFDRDLDRLFATAVRADVCPLGAGALAGSTLPILPQYVADRLAFDRPFENSIDAVSDRDPLAELLFDLALTAVHASSLGEEVVVFASKEFGFVERTAALGSGSSLMPQKRNPDVAELVRGKTGRVVGDLVALLTVLKGLPLAYDRDLQEDKAPVLDAVSTLGDVTAALTNLVRELQFNRDRLNAAASDPELLATDRAEQLVSQGEPFRAAHEAVARDYAAEGKTTSAPDRSTSNRSGAEASASVSPERALERRSSPGGPAPAPVARQFVAAKARIIERQASLSSLDRKVGLIEELLSEGRK